MIPLYTITIFIAAALLFGVQPMVAKSLLPGYGGGSSVWTTCMLFFQTLLIAGYLYAHVMLRYVPRRAQMVVHGVVVAGAIAAGWFYQSPVPPPDAEAFPVPWLIGQLFLIAGLPYFAVSSAGPLVQGWFARTDHARAQDPYFLYAASNAGSLLGLLAYPFLVEPMLGLREQRGAWLIGFGCFGVLALACVLRTRAGRAVPEVLDAPIVAVESPGRRRRMWWLFLAFVPSSMLLAVTMHITTDVASFPLLWVVPLALYLVTMIAAFSRFGPGIARFGARPMIVCVIAAWVLLFASVSADRGAPIVAGLLVQLALLTAVGLYAHARLAQDRPDASRLTEFYLVMSVGGALGGLFNGIVAPLLFDDVYEYHITLLAALMVIPGVKRAADADAVRFWTRRLTPALLSLVLVVLYVVLRPSVGDGMLLLAGGAIAPGLLMYIGWRDRVMCAGALCFPLMALALSESVDSGTLHKERTFFGVHTIDDRVLDGDGSTVVRRLLHGTTLHGLQMFEQGRAVPEPMGYYHTNGPLGAAMRTLDALRMDGARVALIGLGTGATAYYARPGDEYLYYEIDPAVVRIARDSGYFSYLHDAGPSVRVEVGDGRLLLERSEASGEPPFDMIIVDAFSSDSIPTHLLTVEAVALYFQRLAPGGIVAMHISNRHLDLAGLIHAMAQEEGATAQIYSDDVSLDFSQRTGRFASIWVTLTKDPETGLALRRAGFTPYEPEHATRFWTDQYSNLLGVFVTE